MSYVKNKNRRKLLTFLAPLLLAGGTIFLGWLMMAPVFAQSVNRIGVSVSLYDASYKPIPNGTYEVRFALYASDRTESDPYPSNSDSRIWEETQEVEVRNGILRAFLGEKNAFSPEVLASDDHYLGVRIGTDSEMYPRKRMSAVRNALNTQYLQGKTIGMKKGNIPLIGKSNRIDVKLLPSATSYLGDTIEIESEVDGVLPIANGGIGLDVVPGAGQILIGTGSGYTLGTMSSASISADSLDFTEFSDTLTLDAATDIALGALTLSTSGTGAVSLGNTGLFTVSGNIDFNGGSNDIAGTLNLSGGNLTSTGALTLTPQAGSNLNVNLSTTGDFAVNTNQLYVDTSTGFVGIGDATPLSMFTVGSGDLFQVNSSGQVAAATGITSSGTITFSGLGSGAVYSSSGTLASEAQLGVSRGGTGLDGSSAANGTLLIGNGSGYSLATLTPSFGIDVTNDIGGITIASTTFTESAGIISKVSTTDRLVLSYGFGASGIATSGDTQLTITNVNGVDEIAPLVDAMVIDMTGGASGIEADGVDGLSIAVAFGEGGTNTNSALHLNVDNQAGVPNGDENFYALSIDGLIASTMANESAINVGSGWDTVFNSPNFSIYGTGSLGTVAFETLGGVFAVYNDGSLDAAGGGFNVDNTGTVAIGTWGASLIDPLFGGTGLDGSLAANGTLLIGNGSGYSLATLTDGDGILITDGAGSITIDAALGTSIDSTEIDPDTLDFTEFKDALTLDASTDISITGTNVFSLTNSGTGNSFLVNDVASDTTPFVIDASGSVGIGTTSPSTGFEVRGTAGAPATSGTTVTALAAFGGATNNVLYMGAYSGIPFGTWIQASNRGSFGTNYSISLNPNGGNVGIGEAAPGSKLSVSGGATIGASYDTTAAPTNGLLVEGNVGIGDTTPASLFTVGSGDLFQVNSSGQVAAATGITSSGTITFSGLSTAGIVTNTAGGVLGTSATLGASYITADTLDFTEFVDAMTLDASTDISITGTNVFSLTNSGTGNSFLVNDVASDTTPFVIDASGNVGIGTATPLVNLHVEGGAPKIALVDSAQVSGSRAFRIQNLAQKLVIAATADDLNGATTLLSLDRNKFMGLGPINSASIPYDFTFSGYGSDKTLGVERTANLTNNSGNGMDLTFQAGGAFAANADLSGGNVFISTGISTGTGSADIQFKTTPAGSTGIADNSPITRMTIASTGNVGIGVTNPATGHLQVQGTTAGAQIYSVSSATTGNNYGIDAEATGSGASSNIGVYAVAANATNNSALYIPVNYPVVGANNYAINSLSVAKSYFAGSIGIGDTTPASLFTVGSGDLFQVNSSGQVAAATGITSSGTITFSGLSTAGIVTNTVGGVLGTSATLGASYITADTLDFTEFVDAMTLDASTDISITGTNVFSLTNTGTGNSFLVNDVASDTTPFVIDASGSVGIGTASPGSTFDVNGISTFRDTVNITGFQKNLTLNAGNITGVAKIGINVTPTYQLDINSNSGNVYAASSIVSDTPNANGGLRSNNTSATDGSASFISMAASNLAATSQASYIGTISTSTGYSPAIVIGQQTGATAYAERFRIDSTGNVGIGTTSPGTLQGGLNIASVGRALQVQGAAGRDAILALSAGSTRYARLAFENQLGTAGNRLVELVQQADYLKIASESESTGVVAKDNIMVWNTNTGNVGIGTTTPGVLTGGLDVSGYKALQVKSATRAYLALSGTQAATILENTDGTAGSRAFQEYFSADKVTYTFQSEASGAVVSNPLTLQTNGNVGIGTTVPSGLLSLGTSVGKKLLLYDSGTSAGSTGFGLQSNLLEIAGGTSAVDYTFGYGTSGSLTRLVTIQGSTGNVGIGTTDPAGYTLHIKNTSPTVRISSNATTDALVQELYFGDGTYNRSKVKSTNVGTTGGANLSLWTSPSGGNPIERLTILSTGNVGIGTTTPGAPLVIQENSSSRGLGIINNASNISNIRFIQNGTADASYTYLTADGRSTGSFTVSTNDSERMRITSAGNVLVATTSVTSSVAPHGGYLLEISKDQNAFTEMLISNPNINSAGQANLETRSDVATLYVGSAGSADAYQAAGTNFIDSRGSALTFSQTGVEKMRLTATGNFGIGTTTPTANLQVAQGTAGTGTVSNLAGGTTVTGVGTQFLNTFKVGDTITINGETKAISAIASDTSMTTAAFTGANTSVAYTLTGGTRFSVLGNGNVGIGTTSPDALLVLSKGRVNGSTYVQEYLDTQTMSQTVVGSGVVTGYSRGNGATFFGAVGGYANGTTPGLGLWGAPTVTSGVVSGAPNLFVNTGGNVGIGTTSPAASLDVVGVTPLRLERSGIAGSYDFAISSVLSGDTKDLIVSSNSNGGFLFRTNDANINALAINNAGNVGIGTTTPVSKLDVATGNISQGGASNNYNLNLYGTTYAYFGMNTGGTGKTSTAGFQFGYEDTVGAYQGANLINRQNNPIHFWTNNLERMTIVGGGNVGIGEAAPGSKLSVSGGATIGASYDTTAAPTNGLLVEGNVGIGTTAPDGKLHISGTGASPAKFVWERSDGAVGSRDWVSYIDNSHDLVFGKADDSGTISTNVLHLQTDGNVGIGTTSPGALLDVQTPTTAGNDVLVGRFLGGAAGNQADVHIEASDTGATGLAAKNILFRGSSVASDFAFAPSSSLVATPSLVLKAGGNVGIGDTTPASLFTVGNADLFQIDSNGDIVKLKNLTYSFPSSHTTNGVLTNDGSGTLTWGTIAAASITADTLDFTEFADTLDLDANTVINADDDASQYGLTFNSDLSVSARTTAVMTITQANDVTNDFDSSATGLLNLTNNDTASSAPLLYLDQNSTVNGGAALYIDSPPTASTYGISMSAISSGTGLYVSAMTGSGKGIDISVPTLTSGTGIALGNNGTIVSGAFSGSYVNVNPVRTYQGASTNTDTGKFLALTRDDRVNNVSATYNITGDVAAFSSSLTETAGTIADSSNILSLAQNCGANADCTGSVFELTDAGTGNGADIFLTNTAGTQTNGLLIKRNGVGGTTTNALHIDNTAGTLTTGILIDGTAPGSFILDSGSLDISGAGAITGATGITSSGTITFSGLSTAGIVTNTAGGVLGTTTSVPIANGGTNATTVGSAGSVPYSTGTAYAFSAVGTTGQALVSGGTGAPTFYAPTAGSILFAGTSGILEQDNANFFFDNTTNRLGLGTTTPGAPIDIFGTSNALRLSYDASNYTTLSSTSTGAINIVSSNVTESQLVIGTNSATDTSVAFDNLSQDYYVGVDDSDGAKFKIGLGQAVGTTAYLTIDSAGLVTTAAQLNASADGVITKTNAGACDDTIFTTDTDGNICIDSTNGRIYYRYGGAWHYSAQTAGFQIPNYEAYSYDFTTHSFDEARSLVAGDFLLPFVENSMEDGAVHGLYAKFSDVKDVIFADEHAQIASINLKTDTNATTLSALQASIDAELIIAGDAITALQVAGAATDANAVTLRADLDTQGTRLASLETDATTEALKVTALQSEVTTLRDQVTTLTDFYTTLDLTNVVVKDALGNVDLGGSAVTVGALSADGLSIIVSDPAAATIGMATILPVAIDADADGNDDYTNLPMTDPEVASRDGQTVLVPTTAVTDTMKTFVNFSDDPGSYSWTEKKKTAGNYVGFIIHLSSAVLAPVNADWILVEEK